MSKRYVGFVKDSLRAIGQVGLWTGITALAGVAAIVGILASVVIGGMGLALMGTAIGIGPIGWIAIMLVLALAVYGAVCLVRRK